MNPLVSTFLYIPRLSSHPNFVSCFLFLFVPCHSMMVCTLYYLHPPHQKIQKELYAAVDAAALNSAVAPGTIIYPILTVTLLKF